MFSYGEKSLGHISEGKPDLQRWVMRTLELSEVDISAVDCRRTVTEQKENIINGASWTMDSRHLPDPVDNLAFAIDLYPYFEGETDHAGWLYRKIAKAGFQAAVELGIDIRWGGNWRKPDCPHWHLSRAAYPVVAHTPQSV